MREKKKHRADRLKTWYYRKFDAVVSITRFRLIILTQFSLWNRLVQFQAFISLCSDYDEGFIYIN